MSEENRQWRLGQTSAWFETRGRGVATVSGGQGDHGGVSYGEFQLSSVVGNAQEYINQSKYKKDFDGLAPGTDEFTAKWKEMAKVPDFGEDQYDFIKRTHYDVQVAALKRDGLDLTSRGPAVQDAIWSTSVQMRNLTVPVFETGLKAKFGDHYDLASLTDKDIVEAVQDYKYDHTESLFRRSQPQWDNLKDRAIQEKADLVQFAETGVPVDTVARALAEQRSHRGHSGAHQHHGETALRQGAHGETVGELQTKLGRLGYVDSSGNVLATDKDFGPSTKAAVEAFQRDHGLKSDGIAGPTTLKAIEEQTQAHTQAKSSSNQWQCPVRLDDPAHPDNAFYLKTRELVHQLDQQNGRTPDQRSDQLASALTVSGRASGLQRIDQIALSEDASALWGAQRPPGVRDHFFDQHCKVNTMQALNTPMEQSGAQWPQAMQQFQHQEQAQKQQQVQQQDRAMQQQAAQGAQITH